MLCERCGEREANVRFTEVINGETTEHNLCMQCAQSMDFGASPYAALFDGESQLGRLISGLLGFQGSAGRRNQESRLDNVVCPVCHTTYADFVKTTRFGCADCYEVFKLLMGDQIRTLQGSDTHTGKKPMRSRYRMPEKTEDGMGEGADPAAASSAAEDGGRDGDRASAAGLSIEEKIAVLEAQLQEALREEEYEQAAYFRDEIRALRGRSGGEIHG